MRSCWPLVLAIPLVGLAGDPASSPAGKPASGGLSFEHTVQPLLGKYCHTCHNGKVNSGGLNLELYNTAHDVQANRERWETVLSKLTAGQMPPAGLPKPNPVELKQAEAWIRGEFDRLDRNSKPDPGRVTTRRLNRAEYNNTVRDLFGIRFEPADDFPQDDAGYGFDNNGDVLSLSIVQMEKYLAAAETIARTAVYGPQGLKPVTARYQPPGRRRPGDFDSLFFNTHPWLSVTDYDETGLSMPNSFHVTHNFPVTGDYVIRATPDNGQRPPGSEPLEIAAFVDGAQIGAKSVDGQLEGKTQEFPIHITAGEHWVAVGFPKQFDGLPPLYRGRNPSKRPIPEGRGGRGGRGGAQAISNGAPAGGGVLGANGQPIVGGAGRGGRGNAANNNDDAASAVFFTPPGAPAGTRLSRPDNMNFQSMEIAGPRNPDTKPSAETLKKIFICGTYKGSHPAGCDRQIVAHLATLAYRRPVARAEVDQLMAQVDRARRRGDPFEEQMVIAIETMLVSPHFLFRIEEDPRPAGTPLRAGNAVQMIPANSTSGKSWYRLNDYQLASRLSYFLWSSMPDDELMRVAAQGTLHRPEVLNAQVRRMLKNPGIDRLVDNFGGQWLQFRALESHVPDFYKYPVWDSYLRISAVRESEMFFSNIIREDRPVTDFLNADYTFANEYLANLYGIHNVKGPEFRRISLRGTPRRGILGQVSVLTASSYGNRTSVVLRGKWVLENLLNAPPPPPPANVPDLDQDNAGPDATLRQRMEVHRANAVCASCHSKMDPIGFGLENFDAVGNWREKEGKSPIDASGTLPDGKHFNGPVELSTVLMEQRDSFAQCLTEKMLTFALGRGLEPADRAEVKRITQRVITNHYKFSSVVLGIVDSLPFQARRMDINKIESTKAKL